MNFMSSTTSSSSSLLCVLVHEGFSLISFDSIDVIRSVFWLSRTFLFLYKTKDFCDNTLASIRACQCFVLFLSFSRALSLCVYVWCGQLAKHTQCGTYLIKADRLHHWRTQTRTSGKASRRKEEGNNNNKNICCLTTTNVLYAKFWMWSEKWDNGISGISSSAIYSFLQFIWGCDRATSLY